MGYVGVARPSLLFLVLQATSNLSKLTLVGSCAATHDVLST